METDIDKEIAEALREVERVLGRGNLRAVVSRIISDLMTTNPDLEKLGIPEDPTHLDFSRMSDEEKRAFLYMLLDICDGLGCENFKRRFLERL